MVVVYRWYRDRSGRHDGDDGDGGGGGIGSESVAVGAMTVGTRSLEAVGSGGVGIAEASRRASACAVESSAALSPVKEMVAVPEETATE